MKARTRIKLKKFITTLLGLLSAQFVLAQASTITLDGCPSSIRAGSTFNCSLSLTGQSPAGIQLTFNAPPDVSSIAISAGLAVTSAGKSWVCNSLAAGLEVCILYGINTTLIQSGLIANVAFTLAGSPASKTEQMSITGTIEGDAGGASIPASANPPVAVSVLNNCDLNGDGAVNGVDVLAAANWALGIAQPPVGQHCDVNLDTRCDVLDVLVIAQAAAGGACTAR